MKDCPEHNKPFVEKEVVSMTDDGEMQEHVVLMDFCEDCLLPKKASMSIETLSSQLHDVYIKEAKHQGDVRHKDAYEELPENIKEFDRVLARFILENFVPRAQ